MRLPVRRLWFLFAVLAAILFKVTPASAEGPSFTDLDVLGRPPPYWQLLALNLRYTHFDQDGSGYQSRAGPIWGPGDERMKVEQPQLDLLLRQGQHITHRIWIPLDIVTAASPDAVDVVSKASVMNEAGSFDWTMTYSGTDKDQFSMRNGFHAEENYRSWNSGIAGSYALAEDNTVLSGTVNETIDWFDKYLFTGKHNGHAARSSTTVSGGVTQLLSPTTVAHVDYGLTVQSGQLSNGWNTVPLSTGTLSLEMLPTVRRRHAVVAKVAQWLPWNGALKGFYRFYADDWGIKAHTGEVELYQRLSPFSYLRLSYRLHHQTAPSFFSTRAPPLALHMTADSDLAEFWAQTIGLKGAFDLPVRRLKNLHLDVAVERYFRSNDLRVSIYSCGLGLSF